MTIGDRIRIARKEKGYSQEKLASLLFMKKNTICQYEKGLRDIPSSIIIQLAKVLDATPNYLLLGEMEENAWKEDMIRIMEKIERPALRGLALKQLKCIVELNARTKSAFCENLKTFY